MTMLIIQRRCESRCVFFH